MAGRADAARAQEFTARVFFNLVIILKGVVLAYGATVLLSLIRRGPPWASSEEFAIYLAWVSTLLLATLTFTSQIIGSARTSVHPSTTLLLSTFGLAIAELIAFGVLEPQPSSDPIATVRAWLLVITICGGTAATLVSVVVWQVTSSRFPHVSADQAETAKIKGDRLGAVAHGAAAAALWFVFSSSSVARQYSWLPVAVVTLITMLALAARQRADASGQSIGNGIS